MKKALIILTSLVIIGSAFTACSADKKDNSPEDTTLTPTTSLSEKVSEEMTDVSEDVSKAVTDASEDVSEAVTDVSDAMKGETTTK